MSKEKRRRGRYVAAAIVIAAMLGGLGLGFGTGFFRVSDTGGNGIGSNSPPTSAQTEAAEPEPTQDLRYNITVSESDIEYQGQAITLEGLRERLLTDYSGAQVYELRDNHALKSAYDSVKSLLGDIGVPYIEK